MLIVVIIIVVIIVVSFMIWPMVVTIEETSALRHHETQSYRGGRYEQRHT